MDWNLPNLLSALRYSLQSPRDAIRQVIDSDPPMTARWIALLLVAIASTFLMLLSLSLVPSEKLPPAFVWSMQSPLSLAVAHLVMLFVSAHLLFRLGRCRPCNWRCRSCCRLSRLRPILPDWSCFSGC